MRILGITAEYNPLHNGHIYHMERAREDTGADCVAVVMSGDFTQRGEAAVLDKWTRSRLAVDHGADLVLELPFVYACARGEVFASGAVDILKGAGVTDISFGSECGDIARLEKLVSGLRSCREEIAAEQAAEMKCGNSFVRAYRAAAAKVIGEEEASLMDEPNNILAIEYLKRISYWRARGCHIDVHTVRRFGSAYDEANERTGFAGASALRTMISEGRLDEAVKYMPRDVAEAVAENEEPAAAEREFLLLKGIVARSSSRELSGIYCMGEGLENKLKKEIVRAGTMEELLSAMVSKRYTEAAIRRLLTYVLTGLRGYEPPRSIYGRVLAAGPKGRELLRQLAAADGPDMPMITNINKEHEACGAVAETLRYDVLASDMYSIIRGRDMYGHSDRVMKPYMP